MHHPPVGCRVDRVDAAERAAGDDLRHFLVMLAVPVLVADDGLHAALARSASRTSNASRIGQRDRLFERDQLRAALRYPLRSIDDRRCGSVQKQKTSGFTSSRQRRRIGARRRAAEFRGGRRRAAPGRCRRSPRPRSAGWPGKRRHGACPACPCRPRRPGTSLIDHAPVPLQASSRSCSPLLPRSVRGTSAAKRTSAALLLRIGDRSGDARALAPRIARLLVDGDGVMALRVDAVVVEEIEQRIALLAASSSRSRTGGRRGGSPALRTAA